MSLLPKVDLLSFLVYVALMLATWWFTSSVARRHAPR